MKMAHLFHSIVLVCLVFTIKYQIDKQEELWEKYTEALEDANYFKRRLNVCTKTY